MSKIDSTNYEELYKETPPKFGHEVLQYFGFDPEYVNLNNGERAGALECSKLTWDNLVGSYGSTPSPVLAACGKLTREIEWNPDLFMRLTYQPLLIDVRQRVANLIGAKLDECVLVPNASMGVNTVLRNFEWEAGDIIIGCASSSFFPYLPCTNWLHSHHNLWICHTYHP